jgi:hypothetical protein
MPTNSVGNTVNSTITNMAMLQNLEVITDKFKSKHIIMIDGWLVSRSVSLPWPQAPCGTHDHISCCSQLSFLTSET